MKVAEIIDKAILKYIPKENIDDYDVCGIKDEYQYFLILNTKEIFNTINDTKVYMIMENNEIQGLMHYAGWCGYYYDFDIKDNSIILFSNIVSIKIPYTLNKRNRKDIK